MPSLLPKKRNLRVLVIVVALVVFLGVGYAGARWIARPYFKTWREARANKVAQEYLEKGDYNNALLAARKTLYYNQFNLEACRLAVAITEKQGSTDVLYYQQRLATLDPTLDNKLKFLRLAMNYNAYPQAMEMISKMGAEASNSSEFFEIAAAVSRRVGNPTKARYYLMSLINLKPDDNKARFDLAQLRLIEGVSDNKPSIRAEIRNLASDPALRPQALSLLLADSIEAKNSSESLELADQVSALANLTPAPEILVADAYRRFAPSKFGPYLSRLESQYGDDPAKVVVLSNYLVGNDKADEARKFIDAQSEKTRGLETTQVSYAFALFTLKQWDEITTFLKNCKWVDNEYARHALLAYRYRVSGDERNFNDEWKLALIEVGSNPRRVQTLIAQVMSWNWADQKIELLWKLFSLDPRNEKIRRELILWERSRGNTANLNRIFGRVVELDAGDMASKNNYAYTSMLLNQNLDRASRLAREAYDADPKNTYYISVYAFALYKQGKVQEALSLLESMTVGAFSLPERNLLHAAMLIANGKYEEGTSMATPLLKYGNFLPEEREILSNALSAVEKARHDQEGVARLASLTAASANVVGDRKSWLGVLPAGYKKASAVQMELSDTFYASDDFKGLESSIKSEKWEQNDFLRLALLSYAQRHLRKEVEAMESWRYSVASAGNNATNLSILADLSERWSWNNERVEILNRIYQRDALDNKSFSELVDHYTKSNQTAELARIYGLRNDVSPGENDTQSKLAYYSLLTGTQLSRAHVLAKQSFDRTPDDTFCAKVYALSLLKQSRSLEGWRILEKLPDRKETGMAQLSILKAALAFDQNNYEKARESLALFDPSTALPEEVALSESVARNLAKKDS